MQKDIQDQNQRDIDLKFRRNFNIQKRDVDNLNQQNEGQRKHKPNKESQVDVEENRDNAVRNDIDVNDDEDDNKDKAEDNVVDRPIAPDVVDVPDKNDDNEKDAEKMDVNKENVGDIENKNEQEKEERKEKSGLKR